METARQHSQSRIAIRRSGRKSSGFAARRVVRFDAATGAFHDLVIAPAEYNAGDFFGMGAITVVVPEPAASAAISVVLLAALLRRRERHHQAAR